MTHEDKIRKKFSVAVISIMKVYAVLINSIIIVNNKLLSELSLNKDFFRYSKNHSLFVIFYELAPFIRDFLRYFSLASFAITTWKCGRILVRFYGQRFLDKYLPVHKIYVTT